MGSTVASPLLWFFYEVAPLKRLRWLKPVTELIASEEASKEADQGPIPLVQIAKPKPASSRKGSNNRSLNEESRARKGGEGVVSWILNGIATIGITNANIEEDLSGLRFENVLETMGYEVEYYKCPIEPRSGAPSSSRSAAMNEEMNQI
uniref:Uncharacterized protein n=1 Tax=Haptolina ericina TaxID=156174 RepID=A0A7S3BQ37_9EUKA